MNNGALDLYIDVTSFASGASLSLRTDIIPEAGATYSFLVFTKGTPWSIELASDLGTIETFPFQPDVDPSQFRILFHDTFITVCADDRWIYTWHMDPNYPTTAPSARLTSSNGSVVLSKVLRRELSDWREAIYVDLEQTSQNAISSIIQQRPVHSQPSWDGYNLYFYEGSARPEVEVVNVRNHQVSLGSPSSASSDGIVYYSQVDLAFDALAAEEFGLVTRVYRVPELDTGAMRAALTIQTRARQEAITHNLRCRVDPRVEIEDIVKVMETDSPHTRFIVEAIEYALQSGQFTMSIRGRDADV